MSNNFDHQSPAIRTQQSASTPGFQVPIGYQNHQRHISQEEEEAYTNFWTGVIGNQGQMVAKHALHGPGMTRSKPHQRNQSSSSIGSSGSASPFSQGHGASYSYAVSDGSPTPRTASSLGQQYNVDRPSRAPSNHLPTPTQTPTSDSFLASSFPTYNQQAQANSIGVVALGLNHAIDQTLNNDEDLPGMSHSARQSVSSTGQDPSTPQTVAVDLYEDGYQQQSHSEINSSRDTDLWMDVYLPVDDADTAQRPVPKFDRTMSDIYQDNAYNPTSASAIQTQRASRPAPANQYLSPSRSVITQRLEAAQMARSQSPTSATSRGLSPFRPDSLYVQDPYVQASRFHTASQARQRQKQKADANELSQHQSHPEESTPKTISPKDAILDYHESEEDSKMPLFSENNRNEFTQQMPYASGHQSQQNYQVQGQFDTSSAAQAAFENIGAAVDTHSQQWTNPRGQSGTNYSTSSPMPAQHQQQQQRSYNYTATPASGNAGVFPFSSPNYRSTSSSMPATKSEETPDFPAHLTSMESSASEAPASSQNSAQTQETHKPASSLADSGTYTCTYHGCSLRFETPQKLQKHKRDGHRNPAASVSPASPVALASMTSAAILARNSQAGPHKCERINPTTGKPCNTVFSRPYDLTRHEDTIHNVRKQKVRCALCVEEKTFSRNDALTRHMRVVHPEIDFPGKLHRRRGVHD